MRVVGRELRVDAVRQAKKALCKHQICRVRRRFVCPDRKAPQSFDLWSRGADQSPGESMTNFTWYSYSATKRRMTFGAWRSRKWRRLQRASSDAGGVELLSLGLIDIRSQSTGR